jgi:hypothetical protein
MIAILLAVSLLGTVLVLSPLSSALAVGHRSGAGNVYVLNNPTSAATAAKEMNTRQTSQGGARWMENAEHRVVLFE